MKIGVIGLGHMGKHYAINLLAKYPTFVHDINKEAVEELFKLGAVPMSSAKELAKLCDIIITALPSPEVEANVVAGKDGVLSGAKKGAIIISTGTVTHKTTLKLAKLAKEKGVDYLDAPVSGGETGAKAGSLTIMVGGDHEVFERAISVFRVLGKNIFHTGPLGTGNIVKLINNLLSLTNLVSLCEGMVLGVKAGADAKMLYEVIRHSTGRSQSFEVKLPNQIAIRNFEPGFTVDLAYKDLLLVHEMAQDCSVPLLLPSIALQIYAFARSKGLKDKDQTSIITLMEDVAKVIVKFTP